MTELPGPDGPPPGADDITFDIEAFPDASMLKITPRRGESAVGEPAADAEAESDESFFIISDVRGASQTATERAAMVLTAIATADQGGEGAVPVGDIKEELERAELKTENTQQMLRLLVRRLRIGSDNPLAREVLGVPDGKIDVVRSRVGQVAITELSEADQFAERERQMEALDNQVGNPEKEPIDDAEYVFIFAGDSAIEMTPVNKADDRRTRIAHTRLYEYLADGNSLPIVDASYKFDQSTIRAVMAEMNPAELKAFGGSMIEREQNLGKLMSLFARNEFTEVNLGDEKLVLLVEETNPDGQNTLRFNPRLAAAAGGVEVVATDDNFVELQKKIEDAGFEASGTTRTIDEARAELEVLGMDCLDDVDLEVVQRVMPAEFIVGSLDVDEAVRVLNAAKSPGRTYRAAMEVFDTQEPSPAQMEQVRGRLDQIARRTLKSAYDAANKNRTIKGNLAASGRGVRLVSGTMPTRYTGAYKRTIRTVRQPSAPAEAR